jgi:hypothetical protein
MEGKFPLKTESIEWNKTGNAYVLRDSAGRNLQIDPISFLVWIQCDGKTSVDNIVDVFSVGGNRDIIEAAVKGVLEKLTASELLKWV